MLLNSPLGSDIPGAITLDEKLRAVGYSYLYANGPYISVHTGYVADIYSINSSTY